MWGEAGYQVEGRRHSPDRARSTGDNLPPDQVQRGVDEEQNCKNQDQDAGDGQNRVPFRVLKRVFGCTIVRCRGLKKNHE